MLSNLPEKINNFNVYSEGAQLIGISEEVTLPDFEAMSETISGPGILGEIDSPTIGMFGSMEIEIPFRILYGDIFKLIDPLNAVNLTLRAAQQLSDGEGNIKFSGMRVVVRGRNKGMTSGSVKAGAAAGASVKTEITYILIEVDGETRVELDKLNSKFVVNGVDVLSGIRSLC